MRVFKHSKYGEYKEYSDLKNVIIEENKGFNNIVIYNPYDSNSLCIVNKIILKKLQGANKVKVYSCDKMNTSYDKYTKLGSLNIQTLLLDETFFIDDKKNVIQIDTENILSKTEKDIIQEYFLIVLPKGCVIIRFQNTIKRLEMSLNFSQESI